MKLHKCILSCRSSFFAAKFRSSWNTKESQTSQSQTHESKMPLSVFTAMIKYLYTNETTHLSPLQCLWIISESDFYLIDTVALTKYCNTITEEKISVENCWRYLKWHQDYKLLILRTLHSPKIPQKLWHFGKQIGPSKRSDSSQ